VFWFWLGTMLRLRQGSGYMGNSNKEKMPHKNWCIVYVRYQAQRPARPIPILIPKLE